MTGRNAEVVRELLDAWNRGEFETVIAGLSEEIEWVPVTVASVEGEATFRGRDGVREFFEQWSRTWERWELALEEYREVGDRVVALGRVHARGRGSGVELDQEAAYVFDLRAGELARGESFFSHDEALAAAGLERSRSG